MLRAREGAGGIVGQHSDGNILAVIPDLIEIGLDVLNPIQPSVYDPNFIKKEYGKKITLYGGINVETTLPFGTPAEVAEEMRMRAKTLGRGGGYILQSSHTIMTDVPLKNVTTYIETCHELAGIDTAAAVAEARARATPAFAGLAIDGQAPIEISRPERYG